MIEAIPTFSPCKGIVSCSPFSRKNISHKCARRCSAPDAGLEFPQDVVKKDAVKLEKKRATMTVALTPKTAGKHRLAGKFHFSICTDEKCLIEKRDLALELEVK